MKGSYAKGSQPGNPNSSMISELGDAQTLESRIRAHTQSQKSHVFIHPHDLGSDYTDEQLHALMSRDFETRLFITAAMCMGDTVFLRTRHTDNHQHKSQFNLVRDFLKARYATKNHTAGKAALARLLTTLFRMDESERHSFISSIASGLSNKANNTDFEISDSLVKSPGDIPVARIQFCLQMHIIFNKLQKYKFLIEDEGANAYRIFHCRAKFSRDKTPVLYAIFTFLLQGCLVGYVMMASYNIFKEKDSFEDYALKNFPLAVLTSIYSLILIRPAVGEVSGGFSVFGTIGLIQVMDFLINAIVPFILLIMGFFVIVAEDTLIEAVLNSAALLFIPEIDDRFPGLIGLNEKNVVENFLIGEAQLDYDLYLKYYPRRLSQRMLSRLDDSIGVEFSDYYITNVSEGGSSPSKGILYQPYQVKIQADGEGAQIEPSSYISEATLVRKVTWRFTNTYPHTSKPRVGYLKVEMLTGQTVEIKKEDSKKYNGDGDQISSTAYELKGVFIITNFEMSTHILSLRLCGSRNAESFTKAIEYYSLWQISKSAKTLLRRSKSKNTKKRHKSRSIDSHYTVYDINLESSFASDGITA